MSATSSLAARTGGALTWSHVEPVMGTAVSLHTTATQPDTDLAACGRDAVVWLHEVHHRFTTFEPDSEWSRWARGEIDLDDAHPDLRHVATACAALELETGGAFSLRADPTRGADPAAYVKGWALQRAAEILLVGGADTVAVNGGGDVFVSRRRRADDADDPRPRPWRVGIQHPHRRDEVVAVVEIERGGVATSGRYERGAHIIDPRTGRAAHNWASVTVVGPDLGLADAYATAAFAMGPDAVDWLDALDGCSGYLVEPDGRTHAVGFAALRDD